MSTHYICFFFWRNKENIYLDSLLFCFYLLFFFFFFFFFFLLMWKPRLSDLLSTILLGADKRGIH